MRPVLRYPDFCRSRSAAHRGLTLAELLVVLTIMAVLATVAVEAMAPRVEQARLDATRRTLENVEAAVLGVSDAYTGGQASGFVADVGRLPRVAGLSPGEELAELWHNASGMLPFQIQTPPGDAQVRLAAGWRGPYLRLPVGSGLVRDGWGTALMTLRADGGPALPGQEISQVAVANGTPSSGYAGVVFQQTGATGFDRAFAALSIHVFFGDTSHNPDPSHGAHVVCRVYGPNGSGEVTTLAAGTHDLVSDPGPVTFVFPGVARGLRVVRAYQLNATPASDDALIDVQPTMVVSTPVPVDVSGQSLTLVLRGPMVGQPPELEGESEP